MFNFQPTNQSILTTVTVIGTITREQLPVFIGSGPTHAPGAVPDPGAVAGNLRYFCEDGDFHIPAGSGSVTSVGLSLPASVFTVTGSPITTGGTLTGSFNTQSPNTLLAGPTSGGSVVPTFRALVAADIPNIDFAKITTGTVPVAQGGTGSTSAGAARTALGTAALGANGDITSLTAITSLLSPSALTVGSGALANLTLSPGNLLVVNGSSSISNVMRLRGGNGIINQTGLLFYGTNAAADYWCIGNAISTADTQQTFEVFDSVNSLARLRITNAGNILVPTGDVRLSNTIDTNSRTVTCRAHDFGSSSSEARISYFGSGTGGNLFSSIPMANLGVLAFQSTANAVVYTSTATPLIFGTNVTERMRISGTGKVGINVVNPSEQLEVGGNIKITGSYVGDGGQLTGLLSTQIPSLDAAKITTGTFSTSRIPSLDAAIITSGLFNVSRIPSLDASILTTGTVSIGRGGTGATSAAAALANILPSQVGQNGKVLKTDGTGASWQSGSGSVTSVGAGNLSPLFTTNVTNNTTTPVVNFALTPIVGPAWYGSPTSGVSVTPAYNTTAIPPELLPTTVRVSSTNLTMGPTVTVDWSLGSFFKGTTSTTHTFNFTNMAVGQTIKIKLTSGGNFGVIWPAAVLWPGGVEPTMTTVAGKVDVYTIIHDGVNLMGFAVQNLS